MTTNDYLGIVRRLRESATGGRHRVKREAADAIESLLQDLADAKNRAAHVNELRRQEAYDKRTAQAEADHLQRQLDQ